MEKVLEISANYKIIKVAEELLPSIYCELKKIPIIGNFQSVREKIEKKDEKTLAFLSKKLANYKGNYARYVTIQEKHNLVPLVFREQLARQIATGTAPCTFEANYLAVGINSTLALETDVGLGTEISRGPFTKREYIGKVAYLDKFFGTAEVGGENLREIGVFCDGTGTSGSGFLLSKINIVENMSTNETLTVNVSITINSAT